MHHALNLSILVLLRTGNTRMLYYCISGYQHRFAWIVEQYVYNHSTLQYEYSAQWQGLQHVEIRAQFVSCCRGPRVETNSKLCNPLPGDTQKGMPHAAAALPLFSSSVAGGSAWAAY